MIILISYFVTLLLFSLYSYVLVDTNITFVNHPAWTTFRDWVIQIGYFNRPLSFVLFMTGVVALYLFHFYIIKRHKQINLLHVTIVIGVGLFLSYPFLSHDIFSYMFDAKILTYYHENPYVMMPMDFPEDPWIRFTHWIHRPYPYGPVFLVVSVIPSFLGMGRFILHFFFLKGVFILFYAAMVWAASRINRQKALEIATHPYILIEGLVNTHNDLISLSFGLIGLMFIWKHDITADLVKLSTEYVRTVFNKKKEKQSNKISYSPGQIKNYILGKCFMLLSGGIKFMSLPYVFLSRHPGLNYVSFFFCIFLIVYLAVTREFQQWYIINLFIFVMVFKDLIKQFQIFLFGLLLSYYPYIYLGGWAEERHVQMKFYIIMTALALNAIFIITQIILRRSDEKGFGFLTHETLSSEEHTTVQT